MEDIDTPEIRERLWLNAMDADAGVRGEAICGLTARKDERLFSLLKKRLLSDECRVYELNAAKDLTDSRLHETLKVLWEQTMHKEDVDSYWKHSLEDAMDACKPQ